MRRAVGLFTPAALARPGVLPMLSCSCDFLCGNRSTFPAPCRWALPEYAWRLTTDTSRGLKLKQPSRGRVSRIVRSSADSSDNGDKPYTLTTPLYYVNAAPHMGSAYPTIAADAAARFQRLRGRKVTFITGTDEHGEKIADAAAKAGRTPIAHCDHVAAEYLSLWSALDITHDRFVRTTDPAHAALVLAFLERCWAAGDIYRAAYEGLYCVACEEYKDPQDLEPGGLCPVHKCTCPHRAEANYFFRLSRHQGAIESLLADPAFVRPAARRNEVLGWVDAGLRDFSISRAAVSWGIPVPRDPAQTVYVWFDALLGYITASLEVEQRAALTAASNAGPAAALAAGEAALDALVRRAAGGQGRWPPAVHVLGKDILRFHAVYWPAMLLSAGVPLPAAIFGHGFLTKDGLKMGKSLGNTLDPAALTAQWGPDAVRYYFLAGIEFGADGDFSEERFLSRVNASLANSVGNLLNRALNLTIKTCGGALPVAAGEVAVDNPLRSLATDLGPKVTAAYEALDFAAACAAALTLSDRANAYLEEQAPWKLAKEDPAAAGTVLVAVLEAVRIIALQLSPVTPRLCAAIDLQLGLDASLKAAAGWDEGMQWGGGGLMPAGHLVAAYNVPVFMRLERADDAAALPPPKAAKIKTDKSKRAASSS